MKREMPRPENEVLRLRKIEQGVIDTGEEWVLVIEYPGVHYELLSPEEQLQVDHALVSLIATLEFPAKFWTTARPLGIGLEIKRNLALAEGWDGTPNAGLGDVCRGIAEELQGMSETEDSERHLYISVWVPHREESGRERALGELDRRAEQVRQAIQGAIPYSGDTKPHVLSTVEVLRAIHAMYLKNRHAIVADTLGERGETELIVRRASYDDA